MTTKSDDDEPIGRWPEATWPRIRSHQDEGLLVEGFFSIRYCPEIACEVEHIYPEECWLCWEPLDDFPNNRVWLCNECCDLLRESASSVSMAGHTNRGVEDAP